MPGLDVRAFGLDESLQAIRAFDKDFFKEVRKDVAKPARNAVKSMKAEVPGQVLSGWTSGSGSFPGWSKSTASQFRVSTGGATINIRITNRDRGLGVFEVVGSGTSAKSPQGRAFSRNIRRKYGDTPRVAHRVWRRERGYTRTGAAMKKAAERVARRINEVTA